VRSRLLFQAASITKPVTPRSLFSHTSDADDGLGRYRASLIGHVRKGYGMVMMTNGDNGLALMTQVADRVVAAYKWDSVEKPLPR